MITFCPLRWRHRESGVSTPLRTELSTDSGDNSGDAKRDTARTLRLPTLTLAIGLVLAGCADGMTPQLRTDLARCQAIPRQQGQYERRVRCELEAESRAYLAQNPAMAATWRELIADTLAEYAAADRGEQTLAEADADARVLREAAEAGTGCLTDACGQGSRWHFPVIY